MNRTIYAIVIVPLVIGCGKGGSYTPQPKNEIPPVTLAAGEEASLFPLKEGNQWVYTVEAAGNKAEMTLRVTDTSTEGGRTTATITASGGGSEPRSSNWMTDSSGIYQLSEREGREFSPPQILVPFPVTEGEEQTVSLTGPRPYGGTEGPMEMTLKMLGTHEVDTDMERMSAFAVESVTTWQTEDGAFRSYAISWWVPKIGFVRQRQEITTPQGTLVAVMKLKSYSFT